MAAEDTQTTQEFLFRVPVVEGGVTGAARVAIQMGALASRLVGVERTRCDHPDGRAENVAEHSLMLAKVAPELARLLYPGLDEHLVARFATLHDDLEAYVGDTPTDMLSNLDPEAKAQREAEGLRRMMQEFAHMPGFVQLMIDYEAQSIPEARFVRAVDKLLVILIQVPNSGAVLRQNYTYESYLDNERTLLERDAYKYGEFTEVIELRRELGQWVADRFLRDPVIPVQP